MENKSKRQYLLVDTAKTMSGIEIPQRVYWFDGRCWEIESVNMIMPVPKSKDGTTRFSVVINKRKAEIYKDFRGWYVYPKESITEDDIAEMKKERLKKVLAAQS